MDNPAKFGSKLLMHRWVTGLIALGLMLAAGTVLWLLPVGGKVQFWLVEAAGGLPEHAVVSLERDEHDFGKVNAGKQPAATFRVRNAGGRRLILLEKSRSCGCLRGGRPETLVAPGKAVDLEIKLDTARLSGAVRKAVRYYTNDPKRPVLTLTLVAEVARADREQAAPSLTD